mmetsp:Transcript_26355/g.55971  ORF Transcript_26355/g.55971 Transcript_26355/m.55971 type:complete len:367 (+) Transcript_26355:184-1284(+)
MPGQLRRQWSDCSSSADSTNSWPFEDVATPPCISPPKRRRLIIQGASTSPASPGDLKVGNQCASRSKSLWSAEEVAYRTPSRADGVSETAESIGRLGTCDLTRRIVRELLGHGDANLDEARLRAQVLACYCVQVFFMFASLQNEDRDAVAAAAALVALKAVRSPYQVDDILQVQGALCQSGEDCASREQILKVEERLLMLVPCLRGSGRHELRFLGPMAGLAERLVRRLPECEAFVASCGSRPPATVARDLEPRLAQVARWFVTDAMQGLAPLVVEPHAVATVAFLFAARYELSRCGHAVSERTLLEYTMGHVEEDGSSSPWTWLEGSPAPAPVPPSRADLKQAIQETKKVFNMVQAIKGDHLDAA